MTEQEKRQVIFEFDTEEQLEEFLGYMSDGGGEWGFVEYADPPVTFSYKNCFPDWGWDGQSVRKVEILTDDE